MPESIEEERSVGRNIGFDAAAGGPGRTALSLDRGRWGSTCSGRRQRVAQRRREWKLGRARKRAAGEQARAANATCYAKNYADLDYHFCKKGCNVGALLDHFRDHGRAARRSI